MISDTSPVPRWMPSLGNRKLAISAQAMPTTISPMMPNPVPRTIFPASQPATRPTNRITRRLSLDRRMEPPVLSAPLLPAPGANYPFLADVTTLICCNTRRLQSASPRQDKADQLADVSRFARMHLSTRAGAICTLGGIRSTQRASAKLQRGANEQLVGA